MLIINKESKMKIHKILTFLIFAIVLLPKHIEGINKAKHRFDFNHLMNSRLLGG